VLAKALSRRQPSSTQTNRAIYARIFTAANSNHDDENWVLRQSRSASICIK
jgi:hypothetical protein